MEREAVPHTTDELERLWRAAVGTDAAEVMVIMEPTRNAWVPLAAWFRRRGATGVLVPPEQSADLRDYYNKHTKSDRLDSRLLARLPLLHPDGLPPARRLGPADPMRRATKLRASAGQATHAEPGPHRRAISRYSGPAGTPRSAPTGNNTALQFLAAGYGDPHTVRRLGRARLTKFFCIDTPAEPGANPGRRAARGRRRDAAALWADDTRLRRTR